MSGFVTRFAPSPTGYLHLGHAFSALCAWDWARAACGRFLLRIEDIDRARARPEFEQAIYDDLRWLGLDWETPVRRQSDHLADYQAALDRLIARGVMYRCFKTRRELVEDAARAPHTVGEGPDRTIYRGPACPLSADQEAELLGSGRPFAWRISMRACRDLLGAAWDRLEFAESGTGPDGEQGAVRVRPDLLGDAILGRKDAGTSYHLACVHDDALQGVSHVIRGQDLFASTHLQRLLQVLLDLPSPHYRHHRLVHDHTGARLAKRSGAPSLIGMRENGETAEQIRVLLELTA